MTLHIYKKVWPLYLVEKKREEKKQLSYVAHVSKLK